MVTGQRVAPPIMHLKAVKDNRRRTHFLPRTLACHSGLRKLWTMSNKGYVWSSFDKINKNEGQQQSVASFMIRTTKSDARRAEQTTAHITEMIAKYMLPISFVEGEGFRTYGVCRARVYCPV